MMKSRAASAPFTVWMLLFTVVPLAMVVWFAFTDGEGSFTFDNILVIGENLDILGRSILLGGISTVICLLLAYPLAYSISRATERVQQTMVMIIMLPMWMNFLHVHIGKQRLHQSVPAPDRHIAGRPVHHHDQYAGRGGAGDGV